MTPEQEKEFNVIAENYILALHEMYNFIEQTGLEHDSVWDKANQLFDEDVSRSNEDN